jgi:hypothetical protein
VKAFRRLVLKRIPYANAGVSFDSKGAVVPETIVATFPLTHPEVVEVLTVVVVVVTVVLLLAGVLPLAGVMTVVDVVLVAVVVGAVGKATLVPYPLHTVMPLKSLLLFHHVTPAIS